MPIISDDVYSRTTDRGVEVFFVSRAVTKWWNARRDKKGERDIALLSGWYWSLGNEEYGPFRSQSAAWRDAYYRRVARHRPPMADARDVRVAETEIAADAARERRAARRGRPRAPADVVSLRAVA